jgi:excisionase family DNA binding protein
MANKVWYTVTEASELLGKSERTIRRQIADKKLTSRRIKGVVSVYLNPANLPQSETVFRNEKPHEDMPQDNHEVENDMSDKEKDLKIAQLIKDLDETKGMVDWLKRGYENLQATHYETASALNKIQLQLSPPRGQETANGEVIGLDDNSSSQGILDAKKGKFLSDLTNILLVLLLLGLLVAVVSFLVKGF